MTAVRTRVLAGFEDPAFGPGAWEALLRAAGSDVVYLTWHWQRAWWETFRPGRLLLIAAERQGAVVALAPLCVQSRMVYFIGTDFESDSLDFIGDVSDPDVLAALLATARDCVPDFQGCMFYFVPEHSPTGRALKEAAGRLGLDCYAEDDMAAPVLDLAGCPAIARAATRKKSLLSAERDLRRRGVLTVHHLRDGAAILPHLKEFFDQHVARWAGLSNPSRFESPKVRMLFERFTADAAETGWLRFTRLEWEGRPIAFHYGLCYGGRYFWGPASFAIDLARHSPGQVLLRQLLLAAIAEGARTFDFGTGATPFKLRFATQVNGVHTWALYPTGSEPRSGPAANAPADAIPAH